jgi:anti-anti-sigma factor
MHIASVLTEDSIGAFSIRAVRTEGRLRVSLAGELDIQGAHLLNVTIKECVLGEGTAESVTLDLTDLSFADLRGLRAITDAFGFIRSNGLTVDIRSVNPRVERIAQLSGLYLPLE